MSGSVVKIVGGDRDKYPWWGNNESKDNPCIIAEGTIHVAKGGSYDYGLRDIWEDIKFYEPWGNKGFRVALDDNS